MMKLFYCHSAAMVCFFTVLVSQAEAQYYPRYNPYGYNPYAAYNYSAGAALSGSADVINAKGNYMIQSEDARIQREKAKQAQYESQKQAFDLKRYEEENTPSFTDQQQKIENTKIQAALGNPPLSEITSARALNTLLPYLRNLTIAGTQGPPVPVNQDLLKMINVSSGGIGSNPGILKEGTTKTIPIALRCPEQKKLNDDIQNAITKVRNDTVTLQDIKAVNQGVATLEKKLQDNIRSGEIDGTMWVNGRRYLEELKESLRVLQDPNAIALLGGAGATAEGKTVQELVMNMTHAGLTFAPSNPGGEAAYVSLHNSMVSYAMMSHSESGFKVKLVPTGFQQ
jgi:hypothetical protein